MFISEQYGAIWFMGGEFWDAMNYEAYLLLLHSGKRNDNEAWHDAEFCLIGL